MYQAGLQRADIRYLSQIQMFSWRASLFATSGTYKSLGVSRDQRTSEVISNSFWGVLVSSLTSIGRGLQAHSQFPAHCLISERYVFLYLL